ncbi:cellulase family glycosylhydrolase [Clostridium sp. C8-1-8]|uniref:cellulase family glycosylhydrolase n=1 Tax=Clostridium sp. C8-1-8 TaxID=2698831 RepID=UPI0013689FD4|nr:cellulase family glycosylhydrolase [Clostridium sp. C8-1-8]
MSKVKSSKLFLLVVAFLFANVIPSWGLVAHAATTLSSDFTQLNASQIVSSMGAGWNLGNQLEASNSGTPSETAWGNPTITKSLIQKVKAAGFKTIRIPVSYLSTIGSAPDYTINSAWLARVKEVVDYAYSEGLYVIINMHGDGYKTVSGSWLICDSGDQATIKAKYQKVWQQIANTFVNYNEHLIFESMNEEFDGTYGTPNATYYANINAYNQIFVDTVRQTGGNNSARWLLIPGWNTNIDYTVGNYGFALPTDNYRSATIPASEKRIMLSAHYYSPWDFCGEESGTITQWGSTSTNSSRKSTWGQEDYLTTQLKAMYDKFVTQGYPVILGEYGSVDKTSADSTNNTYRAAFAKAVCSTAKQYSAVPVYWDNGYNGAYGFGLFNRSTNAVTQQGIIDAIMSGIGTTIAPSSTITPTTATFDIKISAQSDISVVMNLNGNTLSAISNGSTALVAGTDYTISSNTVTISKSYLAKQPIGTTNLTFDFSAGNDPVIGVNIIDSSDQSASIKIQEFNGTTSVSSNTLSPKLKLTNTSTSAITLSNVKIRYYYTTDTDKAQNFFCDWSTVGSSNVTGTFGKLSTAKTGADSYVEIGFTSTAGTLAAGQSVEIQVRVSKVDWTNYTQTGDYSFNSTATSYTDWNKVTGYLSGVLKYGVEP